MRLGEIEPQRGGLRIRGGGGGEMTKCNQQIVAIQRGHTQHVMGDRVIGIKRQCGFGLPEGLRRSPLLLRLRGTGEMLFGGRLHSRK